ncbi:hypothetical protein BDZ91DRAFT_736704, partial [Kalaharituber pfeilii]
RKIKIIRMPVTGSPSALSEIIARSQSDVPLQSSAKSASRDPDLTHPDPHLTQTKLDELWDWFQHATQQNTDPQHIFAKLVNSVRNCYQDENPVYAQDVPLHEPREPAQVANCEVPKAVERASVLEEVRAAIEHVQEQVAATTASIYCIYKGLGELNIPGDSVKDVDILGWEIDQRSITSISLNEVMLGMVHKANELHSYFSSLKAKYDRQLDRTAHPGPHYVPISDASTEEQERKAETTGHQCCRKPGGSSSSLEQAEELSPNFNAVSAQNGRQLGTSLDLEPTYVAIKSAHFADRYVQMMSDQGTVQPCTSINGWSIFELIRPRKGIVSFKTTWLTDGYLSANPPAHTQKDKPWDGWKVECKPSCGKNEEFRILPTEYQGVVGIQLAGASGGISAWIVGCLSLHLEV